MPLNQIEIIKKNKQTKKNFFLFIHAQVSPHIQARKILFHFAASKAASTSLTHSTSSSSPPSVMDTTVTNSSLCFFRLWRQDEQNGVRSGAMRCIHDEPTDTDRGRERRRHAVGAAHRNQASFPVWAYVWMFYRAAAQLLVILTVYV